jgi:outer membrane protein assembly factor BamB
VIWQKDLVALYGGTVIRFQNAASPLIEGGLIYLNANSASSCLMALRTSDGSVAWRSQNETLTHSTPVLATIQGVRQLVFATGSGLIALNPLTGVMLWRCNYPWTYNPLYPMSVSPVVHQDMVFMSAIKTSGYGTFVRRVTVTNSLWTSTQLWFASDPSTAFITPVAREGCVYGTFGAEYNSPPNQLKCVDLRTGAVKWSQAGFGRCGVLIVDNYLLALTETGQLVLAQVNTNAYVEVGRFTAIPAYNGDNNKCWNVPAIVDGKVYVRSTSYGAAFDFSLPDPKPALTLDPPWPSSGNQFELTVRAANGTPLDSNRLAGMEVRASTNLALSPSAWPKLTNTLLLTNGVGRVLNVEGGPPRQYFIIRESP